MASASDGNNIADLYSCFYKGLKNNDTIEARMKREIVSSHCSSVPLRVRLN
jgi:hypothetical protein